VAAGYASRGVVWAGLLGEALADRMTGQPLPLELELMRAIAPGRFGRLRIELLQEGRPGPMPWRLRYAKFGARASLLPFRPGSKIRRR
jgi:hypothetical protein